MPAMPLRDRLVLRDAAVRALLAEGWSVREVVAMERRCVIVRRATDIPEPDRSWYLDWMPHLGEHGLLLRYHYIWPVEPATADAIYAYMATRVDPLEPLFLSERRRRISADTVWRIKRNPTVA